MAGTTALASAQPLQQGTARTGLEMQMRLVPLVCSFFLSFYIYFNTIYLCTDSDVYLQINRLQKFTIRTIHGNASHDDGQTIFRCFSGLLIYCPSAGFPS